MCHASAVLFGAINVKEHDVKGKTVIEVGSYNVNGSLRPLIESYQPEKYIGVDIIAGSGVDVVCPAENLVNHFGEKSFDVVISTELLEHVRDWRMVISNLKKICKPEGILLITTRSKGFAYHAFPYDFWRYEEEDFETIFSDLSIIKLEPDLLSPGVFILAKKPNNFVEKTLDDISLYSMVSKKRIKKIPSGANKLFLFKTKCKFFVMNFIRKTYYRLVRIL
jgi:SAM-dependent methyltransferase